MIQISSKDTLYMYNLYHIVKAFFPNEEISQNLDEKQESLVSVKLEENSCFYVPVSEIADCPDRQDGKKKVTKIVYDWLSKVTGRTLAWGMLTGVRPTKLAMQKLEAGMSRKEVCTFLEQEYGVSHQKAELGIAIAEREKELLGRLDYEQGFSLYVGIPFCPSICSYCSFSSSPLAEWKDRVDDYLKALCQEIRALGERAEERKLNTIYIGGGTPTTLEPHQLERLLSEVEKCFDISHIKEYTVEAGRPDSITREKLAVIRKHPVTRISINPQTMNQKTLDIIGRRHTVEDIRKAFADARELGFDNINMDLIVGLPGEGIEEVEHTMQEVLSLDPDSITVHSLAIKRAARLNLFKDEYKEMTFTNNQRIMEMTEQYAAKAGMFPYYLYRQKNMKGNFENVGYAKPEKEGIYNILIMEEKQSILALGAGASTKFVMNDRIERAENVKDIKNYIERIDEMIERKKQGYCDYEKNRV